jgi:hypothetical protein
LGTRANQSLKYASVNTIFAIRASLITSVHFIFLFIKKNEKKILFLYILIL